MSGLSPKAGGLTSAPGSRLQATSSNPPPPRKVWSRQAFPASQRKPGRTGGGPGAVEPCCHSASGRGGPGATACMANAVAAGRFPINSARLRVTLPLADAPGSVSLQERGSKLKSRKPLVDRATVASRAGARCPSVADARLRRLLHTLPLAQDAAASEPEGRPLLGSASSASSTASFRQSRHYTRCPVTALTPKPEGGARCVSGARRDLGRGRGAILVPARAVRIVFLHQRVLACGFRCGRAQARRHAVPNISLPNVTLPASDHRRLGTVSAGCRRARRACDVHRDVIPCVCRPQIAEAE
jgi:hypothetical protein